jgi:adenylate kinase
MELNLTKGQIDNILVMGKSGSGKQPRINVFVDEFGLEQLSTGDIFRSYLKAFDRIGYPGNIGEFYDDWSKEFLPDSVIKTKIFNYLKGHNSNDVLMGIKAKYYVSNGQFVPDSLTNELFLSSFKKHKYQGVVHDGFPRTVDQAKFLISLMKKNNKRIDAILLVNNDDRTILLRTSGRRICPNCQRVFHIEFKPLKDGKYCTNCGTEAITRVDDKRESLLMRLKEYRDKTQHAIEYLISCGIPYVVVPGNLPVLSDEAVKNSVLDAIAKHQVVPFEFERTG